jgi:DNA-binding NtrC family response regulator
MPLSAQAKLLRVLQERTVERIGGNRELQVDVRVIAATNRDLKVEAAQGRFREDLFYRLNVIPVQIPPLRERQEDILPLTRRFLDLFSEQMGRPDLEITPDAKRLLLGYRYPGNVRELKNAVERSVALCSGRLLSCDDLPQSFTTAQDAAPVHDFRGSAPHHSRMHDGAQLAADLTNYQDHLIDQALASAGHNKGEAARLLGISRKTLWKKLKQRETIPVTAG